MLTILLFAIASLIVRATSALEPLAVEEPATLNNTTAIVTV